MQFKKSLMTATLLAVGGFAAMSSANAAGTAEDSFDVKLKIDSVCTVVASGAVIDFASQDAGVLEDTVGIVTSSSTINVNCSLNAPYVVSLASLNVPGTTGTGTMNGPGDDVITYQLYSDALGANVWGNDGVLSGAIGNSVSGTGEGLSTAATTHQVYAKLTSTTDIQLGDYSDTVTASVIY